MKEFFDSSVFVSAFWNGHASHAASLKLLSRATRKKSFCALHSLAEVYATMTALPVREVIPPEQALLFIEAIRERCTLVALDESDYARVLQQVAEKGFTSGRINDALLLRCAAKVKADLIYTWNLKHFRAIDSSLASKVRSPRA